MATGAAAVSLACHRKPPDAGAKNGIACIGARLASNMSGGMHELRPQIGSCTLTEKIQSLCQICLRQVGKCALAAVHKMSMHLPA